MYLIEITVDCREPLPDMQSVGLEGAKRWMRDIVANILMMFYETVQIIEIRLHTSAHSRCYAMYVRARCDGASALVRRRKVESVEVTLEDRLTTTLTEFFEDVEVKRVTITRVPAPISKS